MKSIIALLLFSIAAHAECQTVDFVKADIAKQMPTAVITDLGKAGTQAFLTRFNAAPPVSNHTADLIIVADKPDAPRIAVVYFKNGCYVEASFPERGLFDQIMGQPL